MEHRVFKYKIILNYNKPFPRKHLSVIKERNFFRRLVQLSLVVQMLDSAIHWINHYPADGTILISVILFRWIVIYPVDSAIQRLNNLGQDKKQRQDSKMFLYEKCDRAIICAFCFGLLQKDLFKGS